MPARPSRIVIRLISCMNQRGMGRFTTAPVVVGGLHLGRDVAPGEDAVAGHGGSSSVRPRRGGPARYWVGAPAATRSAIAPPSTMSVKPAAAICAAAIPLRRPEWQ